MVQNCSGLPPPSQSGAHVPLVNGLGYQSDDPPTSSAGKNGWNLTSMYSRTPHSPIETACLPDMQKKLIIKFLFENRIHWHFKFRLLLFTVCTCV